LKDIEIRLISELMKNSRRSDRDLAKAVGVSQPTIGRTIKKLEKEGCIKEYTIIPDFAKLGYTLLGLTLVKRPQASGENAAEIHKMTAELEKRNPYANLMAVNGMGLGKDVLFATFYKDYSEYTQAIEVTKTVPFTDVDSVESFLVNVSDPNNYRLLTMRKVADHSIASHKKEGNEPRKPPK
jgi:DNA-binding Lrp family transcriptional regulator